MVEPKAAEPVKAKADPKASKRGKLNESYDWCSPLFLFLKAVAKAVGPPPTLAKDAKKVGATTAPLTKSAGSGAAPIAVTPGSAAKLGMVKRDSSSDEVGSVGGGAKSNPPQWPAGWPDWNSSIEQLKQIWQKSVKVIVLTHMQGCIVSTSFLFLKFFIGRIWRR